MEAHISRLGKVLDINLRWEQMGRSLGTAMLAGLLNSFPFCTVPVQ